MPVILLVTVAAYLGSLQNELLYWDDDKYIIDNLLLREFSLENLKLIFTEHYYYIYHPFTLLSYMIDYMFTLQEPAGYHLTGLIIHSINTCLVFCLVFYLSRNKFITFITSLLFGIHTLNVEAVVWISARKDLLYTMFYLSALLSYVRYIKLNKSYYYIACIILFIFSLLSKGTAVSMTLVIVLTDIFYRRGISIRRLVMEKIPFVLPSIFFGIIAIKSSGSGGALAFEYENGFFQQFIFACYGLSQYILKLIFPFRLSAFYPYPYEAIASGEIPLIYYSGLLIVFLVLIALIILIKKRISIPAYGIVFFLLTIIFVAQYLPLGSYIMADRYVYLPSVGIFMGIGYLFLYINKKIPELGLRIIERSLWVILAIYISVLFSLTLKRSAVWKDSITLFNDVLRKYENAYPVLVNRGIIKIQNGEFHSAIEDIRKSITMTSDNEEAYINRGIAKKAIKDYSGALSDYNEAIKLNENSDIAYFNRAVVKEIQSDTSGAVSDYMKAIEINPSLGKAYNNLGILYSKKGNLNQAVSYFSGAITTDNNFWEAYSNRGAALAEAGFIERAVRDYDTAIIISQGLPGLYYSRSELKLRSGELVSALEDLNKCIELGTINPGAFLNRALLKVTVNDYVSALEDLNMALKLNPDYGYAYFIRGIVNRDTGKINEACKDFKKAGSKGYNDALTEIEKSCQ